MTVKQKRNLRKKSQASVRLQAAGARTLPEAGGSGLAGTAKKAGEDREKRKQETRRGKVSSRVYAGFHHDGSRLATLHEVRDPSTPTRSLGELSHGELAKLVLARLRRDNSFVPMRMLGVKGVIDRERAVREVAALSPVGLHLIEIEKEYIRLQLLGR